MRYKWITWSWHEYTYIYIMYIKLYISIYIYIWSLIYISLLYQPISIVGRVIAYGPGDWASISCRVISKTQKWYLMPPHLTLNTIRYVSRVKWSNPGKGVVLSFTPWYSRYWSFSIYFTFTYIYNCKKN